VPLTISEEDALSPSVAKAAEREYFPHTIDYRFEGAEKIASARKVLRSLALDGFSCATATPKRGMRD
jgi:hypothetical protein